MTYRWRLVDLFGEYGVVQLRRGRGDLEAGTRCRTCTFHIFASPEETVGGAYPPALGAAVFQEQPSGVGSQPFLARRKPKGSRGGSSSGGTSKWSAAMMAPCSVKA